MRHLTASESLALICACGECGARPETWECESKDDAAAKAEAARVWARLDREFPHARP